MYFSQGRADEEVSAQVVPRGIVNFLEELEVEVEAASNDALRQPCIASSAMQCHWSSREPGGACMVRASPTSIVLSYREFRRR